MKVHIFSYCVINGTKSDRIEHDEIAEVRSESTINSDLEPIRKRIKAQYPNAEMITLNHKILKE